MTPKLISDETYARIYHMTWGELANEYEKLESDLKLLVQKVEGIRRADNPRIILTPELNNAFAEMSYVYLRLPAHLREETP